MIIKNTLPTQEVLRSMFIYEPGTGKLIWKERPAEHFKGPGYARYVNSRKTGKEAGAILRGKRGYARRVIRISLAGNDTLFYAHRIIWELLYGPLGPEQEIDHIDGDALNNKLENLRIASRSNNLCNTRIRIDNKTGQKGVHWDKARSKYAAAIRVNGKDHKLGRFVSFEEARAAYAKASEHLHGEFARATAPPAS